MTKVRSQKRLLVQAIPDLKTSWPICSGDDLAWASAGSCRSCDPDEWHTNSKRKQARAIKICLECPVRVQCLEFALAHDERGVWGATTRAERLRIADRQEADSIEDGQEDHLAS